MTLTETYAAAVQQSSSQSGTRTTACRGFNTRDRRANRPMARSGFRTDYFRLSNVGLFRSETIRSRASRSTARRAVSVLVAEASGGNQLATRSCANSSSTSPGTCRPRGARLARRRPQRPKESVALAKASAQASAIGPESIALRLPEADVPNEASRSSSPSITRSTGWSRALWFSVVSPPMRRMKLQPR